MKAVTVLLVLLPLALSKSVETGRLAEKERDFIPALNEAGEIVLVPYVASAHADIEPRVSASDVEFDLYTRSNRLSGYTIKNGNVNALSSSNFDASKLNVFVVHGWTNSRSSEINILLRGGVWNGGWDVNLFIVDWNAISRKDYATARYSTREVGVQIGNFISQIQRVYGLPGSQFVLIGHSLGAHIVGSAGASSSDKPGLVIGLDPAGPLFLTATSSDRLDPTDGQIVEAMHTDGDTLGIGRSLGDIDYYPNGGDDQPGCILDVTGICAHARAYKYLAESIENGGGFLSRKCSSWTSYRLNLCRSNEASQMGLLRGSGSSSGDYYLETNSRSPYAQN